eukprot:TRINITY_DN36574_c0_g1_i1.p1 TRINITY_DN36574_c0_g1~~TRINITY_DN36574_c0_g1_i1.p1  ORF type:complete len:364 (+),score=34.28 TRINITY_DN36574_c0_g1_i1:44-1093(+)
MAASRARSLAGTLNRAACIASSRSGFSCLSSIVRQSYCSSSLQGSDVAPTLATGRLHNYERHNAPDGISTSRLDTSNLATAQLITSVSTMMLNSRLGFSRAAERRWVFLGCPGVGKGTYASRLSKLLNIPHIAMGDLVRAEVQKGTAAAKQLEATMRTGQLVTDEVVFGLLAQRLELGAARGEGGFILDGFPRTASQAASLKALTPIDLVVNLHLNEDIIVQKCLGRRICSECGGNFNVADIHLPATKDCPPVVMPPLVPPMNCAAKMTQRSDDTEDVIRNRLEIYRRESEPVESFYRSMGLLQDFHIAGGIPETWPRLLAALDVQELEGGDEDDQELAGEERAIPRAA